ncbi:hypothetical protein NPX13_g459 [Xylaria arbuscula]|uniref:Uncharacterized protein n=1 Tax=Xylaria arbuscula TaxID=114810 RepID=A0A9W8NMT9_9PEZI|nr:hypothetical protein NPX13_g459 [Xylaria arbuscula]
MPPATEKVIGALGDVWPPPRHSLDNLNTPMLENTNSALPVVLATTSLASRNANPGLVRFVRKIFSVAACML